MQTMELGIRGILRKRLPADLLLKCLKRVHAGEVWFEKALTEPIAGSRRAVLTGREEELVSLLSQGLTNREIAGSLTISEGTLRDHLSQLFRKLGVKDRFELALFGLRNPGSRSSAPPAPVFPPTALEDKSAEESSLKGVPLPFLPTLH
jgi:DNA-binding NarL/FixJ family response regulator